MSTPEAVTFSFGRVLLGSVCAKFLSSLSNMDILTGFVDDLRPNEFPGISTEIKFTFTFNSYVRRIAANGRPLLACPTKNRSHATLNSQLNKKRRKKAIVNKTVSESILNFAVGHRHVEYKIDNVNRTFVSRCEFLKLIKTFQLI